MPDHPESQKATGFYSGGMGLYEEVTTRQKPGEGGRFDTIRPRVMTTYFEYERISAIDPENPEAFRGVMDMALWTIIKEDTDGG